MNFPEDVHVKRFTDDGRYLLCFSRTQRELVVYRYRGARRCERDDGGDRGVAPTAPATPENDGGGGAGMDAPLLREDLDERDFETHFERLYALPLVIDADTLCKDFAVSVLAGDYVIVASSTHPEAVQRPMPPRTDAANAAGGGGAGATGAGAGNGVEERNANAAGDDRDDVSQTAAAAAATVASGAAAAAAGAEAVHRARLEAEAAAAARSRGLGTATTVLAASPTTDTIAFHLVRLRDGKLCDRRVFRDDYARLRKAAAVSTLRVSDDVELMTVTSLRWQTVHVLRVERKRVPKAATAAAAAAAAGGESRLRARKKRRRRDGGGGDDDFDDAAAERLPETTEWEETASFATARPPLGAHCAPDDEEPLRAQDAAEKAWLERAADDDADANLPHALPIENAVKLRKIHSVNSQLNLASAGRNPSLGPAGVIPWSSPDSKMFTGIKQKLMTRVLLEALRKDREEKTRRHVSAFRSRYWRYAEWLCIWHAQLLDERRISLRFGAAEDVLSWGQKHGRRGGGGGGGGGGQSGDGPETALVAVVDWVTGDVLSDVHLDAGPGAPAAPSPRPSRDGGDGAPPPEGTLWQRLAAGVGGVGGVGGGERGGGDPSTPSPSPSLAAPHAPNGHWCASPYYDHRLFAFDHKSASPDERARAAVESSTRFAAGKARVARVKARLARDEEAKKMRRKKNENADAADDHDDDASASPYGGGSHGAAGSVRTVRFKLALSAEAIAGIHARQKRSVTHVFHPVFPFAMSTSHAFMQNPCTSFHLRD